MKKLSLFIATILTSCLLSLHSFAQSDTLRTVRPIKLNGPRVGFTYIAPGKLANDLKKEFSADPFITQFGWQFETNYFTLPNGTAGLVEFILLAGGLDQNLFLPSANLLIGIRSPQGLEFGFGPNISLAGAAFVFAGGVTIKSGALNFPINIAVVPSTSGFRTSLLLGFTAQIDR